MGNDESLFRCELSGPIMDGAISSTRLIRMDPLVNGWLLFRTMAYHMDFGKSLDWILSHSVLIVGDDDNKKGGADVFTNASPSKEHHLTCLARHDNFDRWLLFLFPYFFVVWKHKWRECIYLAHSNTKTASISNTMNDEKSEVSWCSKMVNFLQSKNQFPPKKETHLPLQLRIDISSGSNSNNKRNMHT